MNDQREDHIEPVNETDNSTEQQPTVEFEGDTEETVQSEQAQSPFAGFWVRFVAMIIDSIIILALMAVLALPVIFLLGDAADILLVVVLYGLPLVYYVWMTHARQATLGKKAMGLKVLKDDGHRLSLGRIILRETIGKFISAFILYIGFIVAAFTQRKQGLHDLMASSVVVYAEPDKPRSNGTIIAVVVVAIVGIIAVIGILASIVLVSLNGARGKAQVASFKANVSSVVPSGIIECERGQGSVRNITVPESLAVRVISDCDAAGDFEIYVTPGAGSIYEETSCDGATVTARGAQFDCN